MQLTIDTSADREVLPLLCDFLHKIAAIKPIKTERPAPPNLEPAPFVDPTKVTPPLAAVPAPPINPPRVPLTQAEMAAFLTTIPRDADGLYTHPTEMAPDGTRRRYAPSGAQVIVPCEIPAPVLPPDVQPASMVPPPPPATIADHIHLGAPFDTSVATGYLQVGEAVANPPSVTTSNVELDSAGVPWDARIHSSTKGRIKDGTWRMKRGVSDDLQASVVAQTAAIMSTPAFVPAPPVAAAPDHQAAQAAAAFGAPTSTPAPAVAAPSGTTLPQLMTKMVQMMTGKLIDHAGFMALVTAETGLSTMPEVQTATATVDPGIPSRIMARLLAHEQELAK